MCYYLGEYFCLNIGDYEQQEDFIKAEQDGTSGSSLWTGEKAGRPGKGKQRTEDTAWESKDRH